MPHHRQVEAKYKTCHGCKFVGLPTPPEPLKHTELSSQPWQDLAADLMGPLPVQDFSHWTVFPLDSVGSTSRLQLSHTRIT